MKTIFRLLCDQRGAAAIEYAVIASLIAVAAITAYHNLGSEVERTYNHVDENLAARS
jgi:pilus assembly protein Flp/PilA